MFRSMKVYDEIHTEEPVPPTICLQPHAFVQLQAGGGNP